MTELGVIDLARALRALQIRFELEVVAGSRRLSDGHTITLRWSGDIAELERDDGAVLLLDAEALLR
jgi:hypothetical protein